MIRRASAILLTGWKQDGGVARLVVREIVKRDPPDTTLYYAVGDEFEPMGGKRRPREAYGDGEVVFLFGSPAEMRSAYSYEHERIGGLGDMPLSKLRELARKSK